MFDVGILPAGLGGGGHVVYRIVLCNGGIIYVDNDTVGGNDHIGTPHQIPAVIYTPLPHPTSNCLDDCNFHKIPNTPAPPGEGGPPLSDEELEELPDWDPYKSRKWLR